MEGCQGVQEATQGPLERAGTIRRKKINYGHKEHSKYQSKKVNKYENNPLCAQGCVISGQCTVFKKAANGLEKLRLWVAKSPSALINCIDITEALQWHVPRSEESFLKSYPTAQNCADHTDKKVRGPSKVNVLPRRKWGEKDFSFSEGTWTASWI